jgi:hypothetical protein
MFKHTTLAGAFIVAGLTSLCSPAWAAIGSINGIIIDAVTQQPAPNMPFQILKCTDSICSGTSDFGMFSTDENGSFSIADNWGRAFEKGYYIVTLNGYSNQYSYVETKPFFVDDTQVVTLEDIVFTPNQARLSFKPCDNIPSKGGLCKFSVTVTNTQTKALVGKLWNIVNYSNALNYEQSSSFQLLPTTIVNLIKLGDKKTYNFQLNIPANIPAGQLSIRTLVGSDEYNTKGHYLFSLQKAVDNAGVKLIGAGALKKQRQLINSPTKSLNLNNGVTQ